MPDNLYQLHAIVSGHVQGVCFRAYTQTKAIELELVGWVRNKISGEVEVFAIGPKDRLKILEQWIKQGPPLSMVKNVTSRFAMNDPTTHFDNFTINPTVKSS